jgi:hypothetical protein
LPQAPHWIGAEITSRLAVIDAEAPDPLNLFRIHWFNLTDRRRRGAVPQHLVCFPREENARYIDPVTGATNPLHEPRWRSESGNPLMISDLPGINRAQIATNVRTLWRYGAVPRCRTQPNHHGRRLHVIGTAGMARRRAEFHARMVLVYRLVQRSRRIRDAVRAARARRACGPRGQFR